MLNSKYSIAVLIGCLICSPCSIAYAAGEIEILPYERFLVADTRGLATISFTVRNQTSSNQSLVERLVLPEGWATLSSLSPFILPSGGQDTRLVHVSIPKGEKAGNYPVRYLVQGEDDLNTSGQEEVTIRVVTVVGAEISHSELPPVLLPGESYDIEFKIKNTGNTKETYSILVRDKDGFVKSVTPRSVTLSAGMASSVKVHGQISSRLAERKNHRITMVAKAKSDSSELSVNIPVISRIPKGLGRYHKLEGHMGLAYEAHDGESIWRLNYRAQGVLDSKGSHYLALDVRTADGSESSSYNSYNEDFFQALYRARDWSSILGHQNFYVSQLAGHSLSGLGVEAQYAPRDNKGRQPIRIRAFGGKNRDDSTASEELSGIEAKYSFPNDKLEVGLSLISHKIEDVTYDVKSIEAAWRSKYLSFKGGYSKDNNDDGRSFDFNTYWKQLDFNFSHRQGGAEFSGGYQDRQENQAGLSWRHNSNSLRFTVTEIRNNLEDDPSTQILDIKRKNIRASRVYGDNKNVVLSTGYRTSEEVDLRALSLKTIDRTIDAAFLEYEHSFGDFDFSAKWEQGDRDDRIDESGNGSRQELSLSWQKSENLDLRVMYSRNNNLNFSGDGETFGVNGNYEINGRQKVSGYWQRNDGETSSSDSMGVNYTHQLLNRHQIGINASYINTTSIGGGGDEDSRIILNYTLPLDVPLRRRRDVGSVMGRAVYGKTNEPAKDMVLQLGNYYAVTDDDGRFHYPNILAKDYTVQIDTSRGTVGNYVLNNSGAAVRFGVEADKTKVLDIALEPGASLVGRLRTFEIDKAAALQRKEGISETGGLAGVLVQLQPLSANLDPDSFQRVLTDSDGEFNFLGVPPGQWQVVVAGKLPDDYRLERKSISVDLKAQETTEILLKALPRIQTIERVGPAGGFSVSG